MSVIRGPGNKVFIGIISRSTGEVESITTTTLDEFARMFPSTTKENIEATIENSICLLSVTPKNGAYTISQFA